MRLRRYSLFVLLAVVLAAAIAFGIDRLEKPAAPVERAVSETGEIRLVDSRDLDKELTSKNPPFLLDVREPEEFDQVRIKGATLIPLGELPTRLRELPTDRPIVVYCRSGRRSHQAAVFLQDKGFRQVQDLSGGMNAWQATHKCDSGSRTC